MILYFGLTFGPVTLAPNAFETFTYTYTVTQAAIDTGSVVNLATATAFDTNGDPVSDDDGETIVAIQNPSILLEKSAFPTTYSTCRRRSGIYFCGDQYRQCYVE
jgi:hypothetical protein